MTPNDVEDCLRVVFHLAADMNEVLAIPKIGSGFGGGHWPTVEKIARDLLVDINCNVEVYFL